MDVTSEFMVVHKFESGTTMPASVPIGVNPRFFVAENFRGFGPVSVAEEMVCGFFVHVFGFFPEGSAGFEVFAFDVWLHDSAVYKSVFPCSFGPLEALSTNYVKIAGKGSHFAGLLEWRSADGIQNWDS